MPRFKVQDSTDMTTVSPTKVWLRHNGTTCAWLAIDNDGIGHLALPNGGYIALFRTEDILVVGSMKLHNEGVSIRSSSEFFKILYNGEVAAFGNNGIFFSRTLSMGGNEITNCANVASDKRLKKDIEESDISAIDRIKKIKHKKFKWKKDNKKEEIGYIAQELEEIDPNYLRQNIDKDNNCNIKNDMYEVRILPILSTYTKAIQEQQQIIEKLVKRVEKLEREVANGKD